MTLLRSGRRSMAVLLASVFGVAAISSCARKTDTDPHLISEYVHALYGAIRVERVSPPIASRISAYATTALYGALAAVHTSLPSLDGKLNGIPSFPRAERPGDVDASLVVIASMRVVLDSLFREGLPTTRAQLSRLSDSLTTARTAAGVSAEARARSDSLGRRIGFAVVTWSNSDGFAGTRGRPYKPPVGDGLWYNDSPESVYTTQNLSGASEFIQLDNPTNAQRPGNVSDRGLIMSRPKAASKTLPAANMAGATEPYWREVRPFVLQTWNSCEIPMANGYSTDTTSELYRNARVVYDTKAALTPEQKTIAYYWADNPGESGTPVGHWLSIASQMISERHLDADAAARLVMGAALAQADAFIASWGYKYQYNLLRPRMYIRRVIDSTWEPLIPTPPFPEHPAGHATQSSAAAAVITALIGAAPFADSTSVAIGHQVRHFDSFTAASEEAGMSRIYGGIHYPSGNAAGLTLGRCIGARVAAILGADSSASAGTSAKP